tara:strand:+ start:76 stop:372 length:297 start_codon:yes stop_codon:yes gene_type:complete
MPKRKYDQIKDIPIDIIFKIDDAVENYLNKFSKKEKLLIHNQINLQPKKILNEIKKTQEIIKNKKDEYFSKSNLSFSNLDDYILTCPNLKFSSKDLLI